jgi:cytoskeletal protein CcmA (bactofilin family)
MLKKWGADKENVQTDNYKNDFEQGISENINHRTMEKKIRNERVNTILKGSKITGDINVTCDLVSDGDVEGNITAQQDSNIVIKGTCKGNIETEGGNVDIEGELRSGNITTGGNVSISGKFKGGEVKAKGKIYVNCEFQGKLEGNEVELGSNAQVKGELFYREYISISRGAKVEVQLSRIQDGLKAEKKSPQKKVLDMKSPVKELVEAI